MFSPKTPTNTNRNTNRDNNDNNDEPTAPSSVFKRMANWLTGTSTSTSTPSTKRQRLASPTPNEFQSTTDANGDTNANANANGNENVFGSSSSSSSSQSKSRAASVLPTRKPISTADTVTTTLTLTPTNATTSQPKRTPSFQVGGSSTAAFTIGHNRTRGLTNPSFKRLQFAPGVKNGSTNTATSTHTTTNSTTSTTPARTIKYRKATPFTRRQPLKQTKFKTGTATTTPIHRKTYARTPYKSHVNVHPTPTPTAFTPNTKTNHTTHAGITPYTYRRHAYKPTSRILTGSATATASASKLSNISKQKSHAVAQQILSKQIRSNHLSPNASGSGSGMNGSSAHEDLFQDPTRRRVGVQMTRVYGRNQDGSRIQTSPSIATSTTSTTSTNTTTQNQTQTPSTSKSEAIRNRRESAKQGAFVGPPSTGGDYWSSVNQHVTSNFTSPTASMNANAHMDRNMDRNGTMEMSMVALTPQPKDNHDEEDDNDATEPSIKRKKVSFQSLTPPGGISSKDAATTVGVTSSGIPEQDALVMKMPTVSTPFQVYKAPTYMTMSPGWSLDGKSRDGDDPWRVGERREDGTVDHPNEMIYGQILDYKKVCGEGSKGVLETEETKQIVKNVLEGLKNGSIPKIKFYKKREDSSSDVIETVAKDVGGDGKEEAVVPYSFMPKATSTSRKGSSSILNKPIQNDVSSSASSSTSKPAATTTTAPKPAATIKAPAPAASGWGDIFKKAEGEWNCNVCRSLNPKDAIKCVACEAPRPADVGLEFAGAGASAGSTAKPEAKKEQKQGQESVDAGAAPKFQFGAPPSSLGQKKEDSKPATTGGFTFGAPKQDSSKPVTTGGFTFGAPSNDKKKDEVKPAVTTEKAATTGGFTFGAAPAASKEESKPVTTGGFTFGAPSNDKKDETKPAAATPAAGGFTFGSSSSSSTDKKDEATPSISFGAAPSADKKSEPKPSFTFGSSSSSDKKDETKPATGGFSFGAAPSKQKEESKPATGGISFGSTTTPSAPAESKNDSKTGGFSFGSIPSAKPAEDAGAIPAFQFGSKSSVVEARPAASIAFGSIPSKQEDGPSEGKRKKRSANGDATPKFTFGGSSTSLPVPAPVAAPSEPGPAFSFGATKAPAATTADTGAPKFSFGGSSSSSPPPPSFSFGSAPGAAPPTSTSPVPGSGAGFTFGASSVPTTAPAPSRAFPAAAPAAPPGGASMTFGQPSSTPAVPSNGGASFGFGSSASAPPATAPAPVGNSFFGGQPTPAQPAAAFGASAPPAAPSFGFGQPAAPAQPAAAPAFGFGAQPAAPTQFGAPTAAVAQPAGFGFGQSQTPNMAVPAAGAGSGFSIGKGDTGKGTRKRRIIRAKRPPAR